MIKSNQNRKWMMKHTDFKAICKMQRSLDVIVYIIESSIETTQGICSIANQKRKKYEKRKHSKMGRNKKSLHSVKNAQSNNYTSQQYMSDPCILVSEIK